jgi:hypothetical protein
MAVNNDDIAGGDLGKGAAPVHTPVVLFIYNRAEETRQVFEAIRAARPRKLLVIADGPRPGRTDDAALCAATRAIVDEIDWDCQTLRNFSETNMGIRKRFSTAFKWVFENVEEAIFLEQDTLPHPDFFSYCEQLLAYYRNEPRVMWIGGSNLLKRRLGDASYYFNRINFVWGWATWKRAWSHYDIDVRELPAFKRQRMIETITPYPRVQAGFMALFERAYTNQWENWDVQATFTIWFKDGVAIHPNVNLVSNIGFGPQAESTKATDDPFANLPTQPLGQMIHPTGIQIEIEADLHFFDTHMHFAHKIAQARRVRFFPLYRFARRVYRWAKRKHADWRRPV